MRNPIQDLQTLSSHALPLSHRDSTVSKVYYKVHMTRILHIAKISNVDSVMFVNRIREMVNFESLSHRDSTVSKVHYEVHMTRVLHTFRISNVNSISSV